MEILYPIKQIKTKEPQIRKLSGGVLCGVEEIDLKNIEKLPKGYLKYNCG